MDNGRKELQIPAMYDHVTSYRSEDCNYHEHFVPILLCICVCVRKIALVFSLSYSLV